MFSSLEEKAVKKQLIITELFEAGGSNSHFKTLVKYFKSDNIILCLEDLKQLSNLKNVLPNIALKHHNLQGLHQFASFTYKTSTNIKEGFKILKSLSKIFLLSVKNQFADVTISAVAPEKHLYLLWLPFLRVTYILHTLPSNRLTNFSQFTCNIRLGRRKKIIVVSNAMNKILCENWGINASVSENIITIYNTSLQNFKFFKPDMMEKKIRMVLTIGRVDENKNPKVWFEVAKTISTEYEDVVFTWLGDGPLLNEYKVLSKAYQKINFLGQIQNVEQFLAETTVYYQPSYNESQGIAVLEAMQNSLPCIVSNVGGLVESVLNNVNGLLVSPPSVEEHLEAFHNLLTNHDLSQMGHRSFERYHKLFSYDNFETSMDKIFLN